MAPECLIQCSVSRPEIQQFEKQFTQDVYSFGLVTYQIAANGAVPYQDAGDVLEAKSADLELETLLKQLPVDTPIVFRSIIVKTTKLMPPERASLKEVDKILKDFHTNRHHSDRYKQA